MGERLRWEQLGPARWGARVGGVAYELDFFEGKWWAAVWHEEQREGGPVLWRRGLGTHRTLAEAELACQREEWTRG